VRERVENMSSIFIRQLSDHNAWATAALIRDAQRLTAEQFHRRFEIGPGSIHDTLLHIIGAMQRWADRISERPLRASIESESARHTPAELGQLLDEAAVDLARVASDVEACGDWDGTLVWVMEAGPTYRFTRAAAMLHVLTHGVHHRAQILNMRRQLGLPPLGLDLDVVEWECVKTGQMKDGGSDVPA
jgi:uncharacterized damage-inducible protein DinB